MKEDKYTKSLAKNQVCAALHMRGIWKNVLAKFINFVWRRHVCVSLILRGTNMAAGNQQKHLFLSFQTNA